MRLTKRVAIATLLVAAVAVPYVGYLMNGSMPFIQDPRGMSATGLVLGVVAFFVAGRTATTALVGKLEIALGVGSLAVGLAALAFAETAAAEVLLAVFMASILVVWTFETLDHAGLISSHPGHGAGLARS